MPFDKLSSLLDGIIQCCSDLAPKGIVVLGFSLVCRFQARLATKVAFQAGIISGLPQSDVLCNTRLEGASGAVGEGGKVSVAVPQLYLRRRRGRENQRLCLCHRD
jgi:hypothetical protein